MFLFAERLHIQVPLPVLQVALGWIKISGPRRLDDAITKTHKPNGQAAFPFSYAIMESLAAGVSSLAVGRALMKLTLLICEQKGCHGFANNLGKADSRNGSNTQERNKPHSRLVQPESYLY